MSGLSASDFARAWRIALGQAALPPRPAGVSAQALLITAERIPPTPAADIPDAPDSAGILTPDDFDPGDLASAGRTDGPAAAADPAGWLRGVVARASTWRERLAADGFIGEPPADGGIVAARLRRWAACLAPTADAGEALARFQRWEGLDAGAMARAAGPVRLRAGAGLPAWAETLRAALFEARFEDAAGACDPAQPLPFETLHLPFVNFFYGRLRAEIPDLDALLAPQAQAALAHDLLYTLALYACEPLYAAFSPYRHSGFAPLAPLISAAPDAVYRRFVAAMQAGGLHTFYAAYPALARLQAVATGLAVEAACEFLRRLRADLPEIRSHWSAGDLGPVTALAGALGDRHRGGRQVTGLTFAGGLRLIYKPKDLGLDVAFNGLIAWLNAHGAPVALQPLPVLNRDGYGWTGLAIPEACADEAAVERYYQRAGALACLVYLLQATDCHSENLIAAGEYPVLVDCETLLAPRPRAGLPRGDRWSALTQQLMADSVLASGLVPWPDAAMAAHMNTPCGICDARRAGGEVRSTGWTGINTDRMALRTVTELPWAQHNLPHVAGRPAHAEDHLDALAAGFAATYRFLVEERPALLAPAGPLAAFRGQFVRFVFRATRVYGAVSLYARRPAHLRDGADFSLAGELLARALLLDDDRPASWPSCRPSGRRWPRGTSRFLARTPTGMRSNWAGGIASAAISSGQATMP